MYSTGSIWIIDLCGGRSHAAALYKKHEQLETESSPCTVGFEALEGTYKLRYPIGFHQFPSMVSSLQNQGG